MKIRERGNLQSVFLDMQRIAGEVRLPLPRLLPICLGTFVLGTVVATIAHLWIPYKLAPAADAWPWLYQANPLQGLNLVAGWLRSEEQMNWFNPAFFVLGAGLAVGMFWLRTYYLWWPLHPLAFTLSGVWATSVLWFSYFLGWVIKSIIMHYGGGRTYRSLQPIFLGLVLGEFFMAFLWAMFRVITRLPGPSFPWP